MSGGHVLDELSAFLDGEAEAPQRVEAHLAICPPCQQRYDELRALRQGFQALPTPKVHPAFATRVTAAIASDGQRRTRARWAGLWATFAAAAILVLVAAGWFIERSLHTGAPPHQTAAVEAPALPDEERFAAPPAEGLSDEELLVARLADALPDDALDETSETYVLWTDAYAEDTAVPGDMLLDGLTQTEWFNALAVAWEQEADIDTVIATLNDEERETFRQLLYTYAEEGWTT